MVPFWTPLPSKRVQTVAAPLLLDHMQSKLIGNAEICVSVRTAQRKQEHRQMSH